MLINLFVSAMSVMIYAGVKKQRGAEKSKIKTLIPCPPGRD